MKKKLQYAIKCNWFLNTMYPNMQSDLDTWYLKTSIQIPRWLKPLVLLTSQLLKDWVSRVPRLFYEQLYQKLALILIAIFTYMQTFCVNIRYEFRF